MGINIGFLGGFLEHLSSDVRHHPSHTSQRTGEGYGGPASGAIFGLSIEWQRFVFGLDTAYHFYWPLKSFKSDQNKSHHNFDFGFKIGYTIDRKFLPFFRLGYVVYRIHERETVNAPLKSHALLPQHYGFGLDIKLTPECIMGLETLVTNSEKHTFQGITSYYFFHTTRLKIAWHI